jgi:hypothetical protein
VSDSDDRRPGDAAAAAGRAGAGTAFASLLEQLAAAGHVETAQALHKAHVEQEVAARQEAGRRSALAALRTLDDEQWRAAVLSRDLTPTPGDAEGCSLLGRLLGAVDTEFASRVRSLLGEPGQGDHHPGVLFARRGGSTGTRASPTLFVVGLKPAEAWFIFGHGASPPQLVPSAEFTTRRLRNQWKRFSGGDLLSDFRLRLSSTQIEVLRRAADGVRVGPRAIDKLARGRRRRLRTLRADTYTGLVRRYLVDVEGVITPVGHHVVNLLARGSKVRRLYRE